MANITLPTPGGDADVWGQKLNTALNAVNVESTQNAATIATYANSKQNKLVAGANITIDVSNPAAPVISATGGDGSTIDAEQVRDIIGAALAGGTNVSVLVNDAGDSITISTAATVNSTDEQLRDRATHTGTQAQSTVTNLVSDLSTKAPTASPVFTGDPKAPTPATADNDTSIATTAYTRAAIAAYAPAPGGSTVRNQAEYSGTSWPDDPDTSKGTDWFSTKHANAPEPPQKKVGDTWTSLGAAQT